MTLISEQFMARADHDVRRRLTRFLRNQYQSEQEGRLAQDIGCDKRTAKNLLNEHWPRAEHMAGIVRRFGHDVLDAVFAPEIEPVLARLSREERELEEALERTRARQRQVAGGEGRLAEPVAANEGRSRRP